MSQFFEDNQPLAMTIIDPNLEDFEDNQPIQVVLCDSNGVPYNP